MKQERQRDRQNAMDANEEEKSPSASLCFSRPVGFGSAPAASRVSWRRPLTLVLSIVVVLLGGCSAEWRREVARDNSWRDLAERDARACKQGDDQSCAVARQAHLRRERGRGRAWFEAACVAQRERIRAINDQSAATGHAAVRHAAPSCDDLGVSLLLGRGGEDAARGVGVLRESRTGPAQAYLGLAAELGLGGVTRDVGAAVKEYTRLCSVREHYVAKVAGRAPSLGASNTREPVACYRLAALSVQGTALHDDDRVAAQLYAEACFSAGDDDDLLALACAPAAALFVRHGLAFEPPPYEPGQPYMFVGPIVPGEPLRTDAESMAANACGNGSADGCAVLRSIHAYLDEHHLAFDFRDE
jgi:hypothetical protein